MKFHNLPNVGEGRCTCGAPFVTVPASHGLPECVRSGRTEAMGCGATADRWEDDPHSDPRDNLRNVRAAYQEAKRGLKRRAEKAAQWLLTGEGDGAALFTDALGVGIAMAPHFLKATQTTVIALRPSGAVELEPLGMIGGLTEEPFHATRRAYDEGLAKYGSLVKSPAKAKAQALWMARRTVALWWERLYPEEKL
jgi:hypothetical protein